MFCFSEIVLFQFCFRCNHRLKQQKRKIVSEEDQLTVGIKLVSRWFFALFCLVLCCMLITVLRYVCMHVSRLNKCYLLTCHENN